jgi:putative flavoprotein involved in K+ transport
MKTPTPAERATLWLGQFGAALARGDIAAATALFGAECFWRDLVAFTWTIRTLEGQPAIAAMLESQLAAARPSGWQLVDEVTESDGTVEAWFTFETAVARGKGRLRLKGDKAWTLLTSITELKGFEERRGPTRPLGVRHGASRIAPPGSKSGRRKRPRSAIPSSPIASSSAAVRAASCWARG